MSRYVGTIRNISTMRRMLDLVLFDDGLIVARPGFEKAVGHMAGQTARSFTSGSPGASADAVDRDVVLGADAANEWIPWSSLRSVRLSNTWFGVFRLDLSDGLGTQRRFEWKRLQNDPKQVRSIVDGAVPAEILAR